jgi:hypothetical protein
LLHRLRSPTLIEEIIASIAFRDKSVPTGAHRISISTWTAQITLFISPLTSAAF